MVEGAPHRRSAVPTGVGPPRPIGNYHGAPLPHVMGRSRDRRFVGRLQFMRRGRPRRALSTCRWNTRSAGVPCDACHDAGLAAPPQQHRRDCRSAGRKRLLFPINSRSRTGDGGGDTEASCRPDLLTCLDPPNSLPLPIEPRRSLTGFWPDHQLRRGRRGTATLDGACCVTAGRRLQVEPRHVWCCCGQDRDQSRRRGDLGLSGNSAPLHIMNTVTQEGQVGIPLQWHEAPRSGGKWTVEMGSRFRWKSLATRAFAGSRAHRSSRSPPVAGKYVLAWKMSQERRRGRGAPPQHCAMVRTGPSRCAHE